jgi:hypothetical protein
MAQDSTSPVKTTKALDDYVLLGRSGLRVSPLCLGAMVRLFVKLFINLSNYENLSIIYIMIYLTYYEDFWRTMGK